jgi:hypothetical protein
MHIPTLHQRRGLLVRPLLSIRFVFYEYFVGQLFLDCRDSSTITGDVTVRSWLLARKFGSQLVDFFSVVFLHNVVIRVLLPCTEYGFDLPPFSAAEQVPANKLRRQGMRN